MAPMKNNKDPGIVKDKRERDRFRAAAMTDEQREEKNRKRREAYKRNKCHAQNKENVPVLGIVRWKLQQVLLVLICARTHGRIHMATMAASRSTQSTANMKHRILASLGTPLPSKLWPNFPRRQLHLHPASSEHTLMFPFSLL